jgi:hypothetical protein
MPNFMGAFPFHESSRRTPGPITTGVGVMEGFHHLAEPKGHSVWVPAFAGTT